MNRILTIEKFPYLLTALLAIIVIQFNYIVDASFRVPILEYHFEKQADSDPNKRGELQEIKLFVTNISIDKTVENFHLQIKFDNGSDSKLEEPEIDPIPPATRIMVDPKYLGDKMLYYYIKIIQPGLGYELKYQTDDNQKNPYLFFECKQPVKFIERSFYTFFLRNHLRINLGLMLIFIAISFIYSYKLFNKPRKAKKDENP